MESGKFWKWSQLFLRNNPPLELQEEQELVQSLINNRRLAIVPTISIEEGSKFLLESVLRAVYEGTTSQLKTLNIWGALDSIDATLLSAAAVKVENFFFRNDGQPSQLQLQAIFSAVLESDCLTLKNLDLDCDTVNFSGVSPDIHSGKGSS